MSYSRWSTSTWYTFHSASSGDTLDTQIFEVCGDGCFTYRQLKDDIELCLDKCEALGDERKELRGYMLAFISDMENGYRGQIK